MRLYNTLSRSIEEVVPIFGKDFGLYACGPTVYDFAHIGHARKYTMDDILVRTLKHAGYSVKHVMNITDVGHLVSDDDVGEDKMEKGAKKYGKSVWEVAKEFEDFFWKTIDLMNIKHPDISCRATAHIVEQVALIKKLETNGFTYVIDDGVYFDTSKFPTYGDLSRIDAEKLMAGARVDMVEGKKHATDFALWKFSPLGEKRQMEWASPWGTGFPGWHIECSAMSMKYLGEQFEIHTGGIDHIPIHHTNEIAQAEAATGKKPFVKYWVHHNFLRVNGEKMSKSLNNFFTVDDVIAKGFSPMALKLFFLGAHYRSEINFTWEQLAASQTAYTRLISMLSGFVRESDRNQLSQEKLQKLNDFRAKFFMHLENDLHTPEAMSVFWEVVKSNIPSSDKYDLLLEFDTILGLNLAVELQAKKNNYLDIPSGIAMLLDARLAARKAKDFAKADTLRAQILKFGFSVEDTSAGQVVKKSVQ